MTFFLE